MKSSKRKSSRQKARARSKSAGQVTARTFRVRGVEVTVVQDRKRVELKLDGIPIHVSVVDGEFHCQLANQFTAFGSIDHVIETLLAREGQTWTLHGHLCDATCGPNGHGSDGHIHSHDHGH